MSEFKMSDYTYCTFLLFLLQFYCCIKKVSRLINSFNYFATISYWKDV